MGLRAAWVLPLLLLSGCSGDSPTGADSAQLPELAGTYKAVLTTFARYLDGPRRIDLVCPGELIAKDQQGSTFVAELRMFHQGDCLPLEVEYRGAVNAAGLVTMDITSIFPAQFENCTQTSEASTTTYRGTYGAGRFDVDRTVLYSCQEGGRARPVELKERIEGLPPDA